ncbi:MAG: EAL domain-containing protein [Pseudomonadota bacterium]
MKTRLLELFACRMCWKIAAAVFALILAVESVILIPSAQRFERNTLDQLTSHAIVAVEPTLAASGYGAQRDLLAGGLARSVGQYGILGVLVVGSRGETLAAAGASEGLERRIAHAAPMGAGGERSADGRALDIAWPSRDGLHVAVRIDSSGVSGEVIAYALRIAGLVALIVAVVTAGTMVVLHRLVLRPVLRLRESSLAAGADPDQADRHLVPGGQADEMGELVAAHNSLLGRVAASKRRDREMAAERARYLSHHEPLTGLPNRAALLEHLEQLRTVEGDSPGSVCVYLVNLQQFRLLNASFGTERCDELLRRFAARLKQASRPGDFVAHLGADRFALARVEAREPAPAELAERLIAATEDGYDVGGAERVSLAVRVGISSAPTDRLDPRALVSEAEFALARVRAEDGARYQFYSPASAEEARTRQSLLRDLEHAVASGELYPVLQPRMALEPDGGARLAGAEVLVRWKHARRGFVSPAEFIPLAETSGLIVPLGERVLADACGLLRGWLDRHGWAPRLAVNLSARQFALPDLEQRLERALGAVRVPAQLLEVEVTESAAMTDVGRTARALASLRSLGVHVSIDDFGTGYSSLAYLRRFAVDAIKIDKSFVDDIGADPNAEAICDAILRLGQSLGCKVVAEGVESEHQVAFLRRRRCDEVQGYFFSRPIAAAEFEASYVAARAAA